MGYSTDFYGSFKLDKPLTKDQIDYLKMFSGTRRMARDPATIRALTGMHRNQLCMDLLGRMELGLGPQGAYYCGTGDFGQDEDPSVLEHNNPPAGQPSLWCQWTPNDKGTEISWDGGEKFYEYVEWLKYIIERFLKPWKRTLKGQVTWQGESQEDKGVIIVKNNKVSTGTGKITYVADDISSDESCLAAGAAGVARIIPTDPDLTTLLSQMFIAITEKDAKECRKIVITLRKNAVSMAFLNNLPLILKAHSAFNQIVNRAHDDIVDAAKLEAPALALDDSRLGTAAKNVLGK
jgi:hypothetical protein